jgi:hypothetical protein
MSRRIVIEEACPQCERFHYEALLVAGGHPESSAAYCYVGSPRTILDGPTDEMANAVAKVFGDAWLYRAKEALEAALSAALHGGEE